MLPAGKDFLIECRCNTEHRWQIFCSLKIHSLIDPLGFLSYLNPTAYYLDQAVDSLLAAAVVVVAAVDYFA